MFTRQKMLGLVALCAMALLFTVQVARADLEIQPASLVEARRQNDAGNAAEPRNGGHHHHHQHEHDDKRHSKHQRQQKEAKKYNRKNHNKSHHKSSSSSSSLKAKSTRASSQASSGSCSANSSSGSSSTSTGTNLATTTKASSEEYAQLALHNNKRALHNTPALTWNDTLADYARKYAGGCKFEHSRGPYGENLAAGSGDYSSSKLFEGWYDEGNDYNYDATTFSYDDGHFTQVIWYNTKQVGCGIVTCDSTSLGFGGAKTNAKYLICEYYPPGNYQGQFKQNVKPGA